MPAAKWAEPHVTAKGERRATVAPTAFETLWLNTGTLCNIACAHCYIESSPRNDRLAYLKREEALPFIEEASGLGAERVGFTGGEPFLNPDLLRMAGDVLERGLDALVLTNAMTPMLNRKRELLELRARHGSRLALRVSLDHHSEPVHDAERGAGAFAKTVEGLRWLMSEGFAVSVAGRSFLEEDEGAAREGYRRLLGRDLELTVFPEMDETAELPEITEACWGLLKKSPDSVMCASSRMVVKRAGEPAPAVLACTLIAYDRRFELGKTLRESWRPVSLSHPHCASFCVLGGATCAA